MEISTTYIISQVFFVLNYVFLLLTYRVKSKKNILIFNTISGISEAIWFLLLWAFSGCSMIILALVRNVIIWYNDKKSNIILQNVSFVVILFSIIIFSVITYDWLYSILPGISWILYLYSIRQKNIKTYKILWIPVALCWILYNVFVFSIIWIIWDSCVLIYIVCSMFLMEDTQKIKSTFNHFLHTIWQKK